MKIDSKDSVEEIQKSRPQLKTSTIKQYDTNLKKLKKLFDSDNFDFLSDSEKVMEKIQDEIESGDLEDNKVKIKERAVKLLRG